MKTQILEALKGGTAITAAEIAEQTKLQTEDVQKVLGEMHGAGEVSRKVNSKKATLEYTLIAGTDAEQPQEVEQKAKEVKPAGKKTPAKGKAKPKPKGKTPKESPKKVAPPKNVINSDGTIDYAKLTKTKRGDIVAFVPRGTGQTKQIGVVLYPDWSFWREKLTFRIYVPATKKEYWKTAELIAEKVTSEEKNTFKADNDVKAILAEKREPKYTDWKKELCLASLK